MHRMSNGKNPDSISPGNFLVTLGNPKKYRIELGDLKIKQLMIAVHKVDMITVGTKDPI